MHFRLLLLWKCRYGISVLPETKVSDLIETVDLHENNSDVWWECPGFCSETLKDPDDEEEFKDWKGEQEHCKCSSDLDYPIRILNQTGEEFIFTKDQKDVSVMEAGVKQKAKLFDSERPKPLSGNRCSPWCLGNHRSLMPFKDLAYNEVKLFYYNVLLACVYDPEGYKSFSLNRGSLCVSLGNLTATLGDTQLTSQNLLSFLKENFPKQDLMLDCHNHVFLHARDQKRFKFRTVGRASLATSTDNPMINNNNTVTFVAKSCQSEWYQFAITFEGKNFKQMNIHTIQSPGEEGTKLVRIELFHPSSFFVDVNYNATDAEFVSLLTEKWEEFPKDTKGQQHIIYFDLRKQKYLPIHSDQQTRRWYKYRYSFIQMGVRFFIQISPTDALNFWSIYSSKCATLKHILKNMYGEELFETFGKVFKKLQIGGQQANSQEAYQIAEKTFIIDDKIFPKRQKISKE